MATEVTIQTEKGATVTTSSNGKSVVIRINQGDRETSLYLAERDVRDIVFGINKAMYDSGMRGPKVEEQRELEQEQQHQPRRSWRM